MQSKGLTLLEILVAIMILSLLVTGLAGLFVAGKAQILHSHSRIATAELGKYFLDPLQMQVRQDEWTTNCLSRDGIDREGCDITPWTDPSSNITYTPRYDISPLGNLRKVKLTITWTERSPFN